MAKDLISLLDFSTEEILHFLDLADELKRMLKQRRPFPVLAGRTVIMLFEKPSLRTRVTFETGVFQMGGQTIFQETRLGERESIPDVGRNLERWVDAVVTRTFSHEAVEELAANTSVPVINALTDKLHPCQILADAQTLREHKGDLDGLKVAFVGDGNNVFASWANLAARVPINLTLVCPEGFEANAEMMAAARKTAKGNIVITHDLDGVANADAVYTDVWASMGQEGESSQREKAFAPYQVNAALMAKAKNDALFMHCLPAHRGMEVTDDVIDSPQSVVYDEAENRMHAQKAVLATLMKGERFSKAML